ncbi:hypothetical protein BXZ70DRAFT_439673 [Cristinia sonorae]|uniref:Uncharacterized protein n=1 Tax=Cristinia sonorae TaxID=1940300 RepID=A0A8K0UI91_9AGAR|nr:hypothetical protein BXZ70DRAFT_439673 [Cristinia sonorae]
MPIITRSFAMLSDLLVLIVTWRKSASTWRESLRMKRFKPKISVLLIRDGTLYFGALLILNTITVLLDVLGYLDEFGGTSFIFINDTVGAMLVARFILNLRGVCYTDEPSDGSDTHQLTSIHFTSSNFLGNLAAPLRVDHAWATNRVEHPEPEDGRMYRRVLEPFLFGLEPDKPSAEVELDSINTP